ncbi:MAG: hypothetical protein SWE60_17240 [Thermodesulfobacteriota bacterium]|nr:hypothetical protein [Thermodesulfobacteriota bacterium]
MKKLILAVGMMTMALGVGTSLGADLGVEAQSGGHLDWYDGDSNDEGMQFFIPIEIEGTYGPYSARLVTAYAYTDVEGLGGEDSSLSDIVDTKVNFTYDIPSGKLPLDILLGLDFNLPTGYTDFDEGDPILSLDPDLVSMTILGEGFNVNPLVTLAKEWDQWAAGIGLGYVFRGEYDFSSDIQDYDPGDIFNMAGELAYECSSEWRLRLFGDYALYGTDQVDGEDFYETGDYFGIGVGVHHGRNTWDAGLTLQAIFRDDSKFYEGADPQVGRDKANCGDEWIASLSGRYFWNDTTTLKSVLEYLWIDENDYASDSPFYNGERKKISLGFGTAKIFGEDFEGGFNIKAFYMDDDRNWRHPEEDRDYKGFSVDLTLTRRF